ncbi:hypothetical protein [uncultured Draconibacterium sp.]|uniref:hypothetical protein n=1 Tax=uncultured Draconibacterium sp. TaxID=1573823 RepID=UPI0029C7CD9C|nr:hypothetical protein [uncultured Draconibacterium sp.]
MIQLDSNNISALIGVLGTLAGVLLGSMLNRLARIGNIKTFQNVLKVKLTEPDSFGGEIETTKVTERTRSLTIELNFDFYNTSELSPRIARDIKILIKSKNKMFKGKLKNENTRRYNQYTSHADDLLNINLSPKEVLNYNLAFYTQKNFQEILDADWFIEYRNDNNRLKRIKINKQLITRKEQEQAV